MQAWRDTKKNATLIICSNFQKPWCFISISQISGCISWLLWVAFVRRIDGHLSSKQASQSKCGASSSTGAPTCTLNMTSPLSKWSFSTDTLPWPRWFVNLLGSAYESGLFLGCFVMIAACKPTAWLARKWLTTCRSSMIQLEPHCVCPKLSHPLTARETAHDHAYQYSCLLNLPTEILITMVLLLQLFLSFSPPPHLKKNLFISVTHTKLHFQFKSSIANATKGLIEVHGNC